jgi:hypothetical protein
VLVSETETAQVCDYGLSALVSNPTFAISLRSCRWLAPEITNPPSSKPLTASKSADVFAFAMLAVEVFTGEVPFGNTTEGSVAIQIASGKRPARPQSAERFGLTAGMWMFMEKCWMTNPSNRPTIDEVVRTWEGFVNAEKHGNHSLPRNPHTHGLTCCDATVPLRKKRFCGLF